MNHEPLTARRIANRLGRGIVRSCYPAGIDLDPVIVTRFTMSDREPIQLFFIITPEYGPTLTDLGITVQQLVDAGFDSPTAYGHAKAVVAAGGCKFRESAGEIWSEVDAAWPEEDAAELIAVLLRVSSLAFVPVSPPSRRRGER